MSAQPRPLSPAEAYARDVENFLQSEFGQTLMVKLSQIYNDLHQQAEADHLTSEQKAFKIERAAGVLQVITMLQSQSGLLSTKWFES